MANYIEIKIKNFSKYIKRGDIKTPNWFAIEHNILLHPDFFDVSGDEFKAYVWIVGVAAHLNSDKIRVYPDVCASQIQISKKSVNSSIEKLNGKRWDVTDAVRECSGNSEAACTTGQDSTGENRTEQRSTPRHLELRPNVSLIDDPFLISLVENVSEEVISAWFKTYGKVWVLDELKKAKTWCLANKTKAPKSNYAKFLTNWLSRGWESYRKNLPAEKPKLDLSKLDWGPEGAA